jgi:hypothetical protein
MRIRQFVAGSLVAGVATLGVGGLAAAPVSAQTGDPTTSTDTKGCAAKLVVLHEQWASLQGRIDVLQRARNDALAHHRYEVAARIQVQIVDLQARQAKVAIEIWVLEQHCA